METTNTTFSNLLLAATISSSVLGVAYYDNVDNYPSQEHVISFEPEVSAWSDQAFSVSPDYILALNESEQLSEYDINVGLKAKKVIKIKARIKSISRFTPETRV